MTRQANLKRLLAPKCVAFIGGDDAAIAAGQCARMGFAGPIWGVNPKRADLGGQPCFASLADLPAVPDAVFLAVPRQAAIETVAALRDLGCGGVVCFTAGFGELGAEGAALERDLVTAAGEMALVGPNCYGLLNFVQGAALWPFGFGGGRVERGIALITQSGMLGSNLTMNRRQAPLAYVISAGNQAMLGIEDYLEVLADDPTVDAIGLHIEGLRDVQRFSEAALKAVQAGRPIVVLKSGSSEIGRRLTVSHTGSLSGRDEVYQALFDRLGIIRVNSPAQLLETLKLLAIAGVPRGRRLMGFTASGGDCTFLADHAERLGLDFPAPASEVAQHLPEIATLSNPLDYTTVLWGQGEKLAGLFDAAFARGIDGALLVQDYPHPDLGFGKEYYLADAKAFMAATKRAGLPAAVVSGLPENMDRETRRMIAEGRVAPLQGLSEAMTAFAGAAAHGARRAEIADNPPAPLLTLTALSEAAEDFNECQGKALLKAAGLAVPEGRLTNAAGAPTAAAKLGFPVALKGLGIAHKSEAGAVRLGLTSAQEVAEAAAQMPGESLLVERMVEGAVAELLVSIRREPGFGLVLVLASGGVLVELVGDARTLLLPTDRADVEAALDSLKVSRLIAGHRGQRPGDRSAIVDAVLKLCAFAEANKDRLEELEVNPLMVLPDGAVAADVLLRMTPSADHAVESGQQ
ncbi:MAG: acetate--CoA ligase family protein [Pseudomonadota bacterium]